MSAEHIGWKVRSSSSIFARILDETLELVPAADGVAIEIAQDDGALVQVMGHGRLKRPVDGRLTIDASTSGEAIRSQRVLILNQIAVDQNPSAWLWRELGINSMIFVPLIRASQSFGVLLVAAEEPDVFTDLDVANLTGVSEFVASVSAVALDFVEVTREEELLGDVAKRVCTQGLGVVSWAPPSSTNPRATFITHVLQPESQRSAAKRRRIQRVMNEDLFHMVVQPIMVLAHPHRIVEVEALARFDAAPRRTPDSWFREAASVGLGVTLELFAIQKALAMLGEIPPPISLAINAGPETFVTEELLTLCREVDTSRIVVELTEHANIVDAPRIREACQNLRDLGVRIAIDDTGTGFASLAVLLQVTPDIIKLDRELTRGIDVHPVRRALASALVTFARETGAEVIAEGVETLEQRDTLVDIGITYGQGFFLARPGDVGELHRLVGRTNHLDRSDQRFQRPGRSARAKAEPVAQIE
jgi:EAL domain-containing protein (putative c-di-GMP-specific phosphodiesterase class I)